MSRLKVSRIDFQDEEQGVDMANYYPKLES